MRVEVNITLLQSIQRPSATNIDRNPDFLVLVLIGGTVLLDKSISAGFGYPFLSLEHGRVLALVKPTVLSKLPIREVDASSREEKASYDQLIAETSRISEIALAHERSRAPAEKEKLQRQLTELDRRIDALVYKLYGLTNEDVVMVENTK